ncbi:MAG TPA: hypothetical protein VMT45_07180 [Thermoanaerobaculaceae bacterium]|nr:hypothetical protein [Thermoanaerobaculaceae bacterium]
MDDSSSPSPPQRGAQVAEPPHDQAIAGGAAPAQAAEGGEAALGQSPIGKAANAALLALAHTARSFILYDPANERIRGFLEDARAKFEGFLAQHGEMDLVFRPWDIVLGNEVVYSDKDRERSLAFRLYRDGVRSLVIRPGLEWSELITLIGILSVRYKGVRTQEDDVVTLLWRADFKHIEVAAVEGLVAGEDDAPDIQVPEGAKAAPRSALQAMAFDAPYRFDYPWPGHAERVKVEHRDVPASVLARITDEDGGDAVPHECLLLVRELMAALVDPLDPLTLDDLAPVLRELRGFLVGEGYLDALLEVVRAVQRLAPPDEKVRRELIAACADEDAVRRFILALKPDQVTVPPALLELLTVAPGDHLGSMLDLFTGSLHQRSSPLLRQLLETQMHGHAARVAERLQSLGGNLAVELFRVMAKADQPGATDTALKFLLGDEEELQLEALSFLEHAPYGAKIGRALVGAFGARSPGVRLRVLGILVGHREGRAFQPLVERLRQGSTGDMTVVEAQAVGEALARLDPERAAPLFMEWVRPPGLLARLVPGQEALRWAAVSGLAHLPGRESEELLEWLARHTSDELSSFTSETLARLRNTKGGPPGA